MYTPQQPVFHDAQNAELAKMRNYRQPDARRPKSYPTAKKAVTPATFRVGDWICTICNNLNFSFRTQCNRCNRQTKKDNLMQLMDFNTTSTTTTTTTTTTTQGTSWPEPGTQDTLATNPVAVGGASTISPLAAQGQQHFYSPLPGVHAQTPPCRKDSGECALNASAKRDSHDSGSTNCSDDTHPFVLTDRLDLAYLDDLSDIGMPSVSPILRKLKNTRSHDDLARREEEIFFREHGISAHHREWFADDAAHAQKSVSAPVLVPQQRYFSAPSSYAAAGNARVAVDLGFDELQKSIENINNLLA